MLSELSYTSRSRALSISVATTACLFAACLVIVRPGYFSNPEPLGCLIALQIFVAALWNYQKACLPLLMLVFLWAGIDLPLAATWTSGRWLVLGIAAIAGIFVYTKRNSYQFSAFDGVAGVCILSAFLSAYSSAYPDVAILKAVSLLMLFLYGCFGARAAVKGREEQFVGGFLLAGELLVYGTAICYFILHAEALGNPNSLGAVMGVVAVPAMLWGVLISGGILRRRRAIALGLSLLLLFGSYSRAGIVAAGVSACFLCLGLRQYRVLGKVVAASLILAAIAASLVPLSSRPAESAASAFLYKGHREEGLMGSRKSVWDRTLSVIREHPWFGSGFGTRAATIEDLGEHGEAFKSTTETTREHGSSYLSIFEGTGILGGAPFAVLVYLILLNLTRVALWMRRRRDAAVPAVLFAAILIAGLANATFEDWLFAPGYYLCVLFWVFAFLLVQFRPTCLPQESHNHMAIQTWPARLGAAVEAR